MAMEPAGVGDVLVQSPPPVLGADTNDVLAELAELSAEEIFALREDGVV